MKNKIIEAIYLTLQNAKDLYEEAEILKEHNKCGRAYSLYHLAFEECGRFHLLHNFFLEYVTGEIQLKDFNYGKLKEIGYERHDLKITKNFIGLFTNAFINLYNSTENESIESFEVNKKESIDRLLGELENLQQQETELNRLKNVGLYVSFKDNDFHLPDDTITLSQFMNIEKLSRISIIAVESNIKYIESKGGYAKLKENLENEIKNTL